MALVSINNAFLSHLWRLLNVYLKALSVDNGRSSFIILLFTEPHLLEGGEWGPDGISNPNRVLTLRRSNYPKQTEELHVYNLQYRTEFKKMTLIFIVLGVRAVISFCMQSAIPKYMVVPSDRTLLAHRSLWMSISHFIMLLYVVSWIPAVSIPVVIKSKQLSDYKQKMSSGF